MKGHFCHRDNLLSLWDGDNGRHSDRSSKSSPVVRVQPPVAINQAFQPLIKTE